MKKAVEDQFTLLAVYDSTGNSVFITPSSPQHLSESGYHQEKNIFLKYVCPTKPSSLTPISANPDNL